MLEIAVDIGGTFTDIVCLQNQQRLCLAKVPTTPHALVQGVQQGVARVLALTGQPATAAERFIHRATIATNTILEQKGAITGVLMTAGFEDILEIGRQKRSQMYDLFLDPEIPNYLAPRCQRVGIRERLDAEDNVLQPLDEPQVVQAVATLQQLYGVQSVAVCYLFSFISPAHELRTREFIVQNFSGLIVPLSSKLDPVFREYERVCVTAFDAYVCPTVAVYMQRLAEALSAMGIRATLQVMQSRGGLTSVQTATERLVMMLLSGPAAGVIGGRFAGEQSHLHDLITLDIGGPSCDVALVREGKPLLSREGRIARYPLRVPMVDVSMVGAGGGSLTWVDRSGGLHVGPQSAGAEPGPSCYDRSGTVPTVTDASVVLSYLSPYYFAEGDLTLQVDKAYQVVRDMTARLHMTPEALAAGLHHGRLAAMLSIPTTVVPAAPGVLSAFGLLVVNMEYDQSRAFAVKADEVDVERIVQVLAELDLLGQEKMQCDHVPPELVRVNHAADLRYVGQSYELEVPLPESLDATCGAQAVATFHTAHQQDYGHNRPTHAVEFVSLRSVHSAPLPRPQLTVPAPSGSLAAACKGRCPACFDEYQAYRDTPIYQRDLLPLGAQFDGPAIVEQPDTTTVVYPGFTCRVDDAGNLFLTLHTH